MTWLPANADVLAFARGPDFACIVNLADEPTDLPAGATLLLASADLVRGRLPSDAAAWLRINRDEI